MTDAPWLILIANTSRETRAQSGLEARGFETWVPTYPSLEWVGGRSTKRKREWIERRAAPGYVFARSPDPCWWPGLRGVDGIIAIRCWEDGRPQMLSDRQASRWRDQLNKPAMPVVEDAYRVGDQVRIVEGPFRTFNAIVDEFFAGKGAWVDIAIFGRATRTFMSESMLEKIA